MATTISSASSPSRSRIVAAPRNVEAWCVRRQDSFRVVEKVVEDLHPIGERIGILSALDRGAVLAHRTLDPLHQRAVSRGQRGFYRLEAIEIGRQGQLAGALPVPRTIGGEAFGQAAANQRQRATLLSHHVGMATQVGHGGVRLVLPDLVGKRCGPRANESLQIGDEPVKRSVLPPKPLPLRRSGVRKGEMTSVQCQGPAVIGRHALETRHRGAVETLGDHLVKAEYAALTCAVGVREGDGRRIQLGGVRPMAVAGFAVAGRTILAKQRHAAREVGSLFRRQRDRVGRKQCGSKAACDACDLLRIGLVGDGPLQPGRFGQKRLPFRLGRQRGELRRNCRCELVLLGIF
jgi:hypothetical protein